jgi:hypothetical protein
MRVMAGPGRATGQDVRGPCPAVPEPPEEPACPAEPAAGIPAAPAAEDPAEFVPACPAEPAASMPAAPASPVIPPWPAVPLPAPPWPAAPAPPGWPAPPWAGAPPRPPWPAEGKPAEPAEPAAGAPPWPARLPPEPAEAAGGEVESVSVAAPLLHPAITRIIQKPRERKREKRVGRDQVLILMESRSASFQCAPDGRRVGRSPMGAVFPGHRGEGARGVAPPRGTRLRAEERNARKRPPAGGLAVRDPRFPPIKAASRRPFPRTPTLLVEPRPSGRGDSPGSFASGLRQLSGTNPLDGHPGHAKIKRSMIPSITGD